MNGATWKSHREDSNKKLEKTSEQTNKIKCCVKTAIFSSNEDILFVSKRFAQYLSNINTIFGIYIIFLIKSISFISPDPKAITHVLGPQITYCVDFGGPPEY
jgi:hypothetical protein